MRWLVRASDLARSQGVTFWVAAGMATNVIIPTMMSRLPRDSFLDIGSLFDGWAGPPSRDYNNGGYYDQLGELCGFLNKSDVDGAGCRL